MVGDFGLARLFNTNTLSEVHIHPLYMSPEILKNKRSYSFKSDIWY